MDMTWDIFDVVLFFWCFHQKMDKKYNFIRYISLNIYVHKIKLNVDLTQNELLDNFVGYEFPGNICAFYIMLANCRFTLEGKQFRLGHYWTVMVIIEMIWYPAARKEMARKYVKLFLHDLYKCNTHVFN